MLMQIKVLCRLRYFNTTNWHAINSLLVVLILALKINSAIAQGPGDPEFDEWILAEAERISVRCQRTWCDGQVNEAGVLLEGHSPAITRNETHILFEAAAIYAANKYGYNQDQRRDLVRLLKSIGLAESIAQGNWDRNPRQFYTRYLQDEAYAAEDSNFHGSEKLNLIARYGEAIPIVYGDDEEYCRLNPTICGNKPELTAGIGLMQLTPPNIEFIKNSLQGTRNKFTPCGGSGLLDLPAGELALIQTPGGCDRERFAPFRIYEPDQTTYGVEVRLNIDRWIQDPLYNLQKAVDLLRFKQVQYSDDLYSPPNSNDVGALIPESANNLREWADLGRFYQTIGGENGWIPIFLGMVPYQNAPTDPVDVAALQALIASANEFDCASPGLEINSLVELTYKCAELQFWNDTQDKWFNRQQYSNEQPQSYSAIDSLLIIDSSGSMATTDREKRRLQAANVYVSASAAEDKIAIIDLDTTPTVIQNFITLGEPGSETRTNVQNVINDMDSYGGTGILSALQQACTTLQQSWSHDIVEQQSVADAVASYNVSNYSSANVRRDALPDITRSANSKKIAILLTDGDSSPAYGGAYQCFVDNGWVLYTIGFASANSQVLQSLAEATGGFHIEASDSLNELSCSYQQIREHAVGQDVSGCLSASIQQDETITLGPLNVEANLAQITFTSSWPGSDVIMTLVTPTGRVISRDTIASDVIHSNGPTFETYTIVTPESGSWQIELYGADIPAGPEPVVIGTTKIVAPDNAIPAAVAGGPYSGVVGENLYLDGGLSNDSDGTIVNYAWDIGDDGSIEVSSSTTIASYIPGEAFTGPLKLTVTDNDGYSASSTSFINIEPYSGPVITSVSPQASPCLIHSSPTLSERTLVLNGSYFPYPRSSQNLQFRRTDTGQESIHFGLEVNWVSNNEIMLDINRVAHFLWPQNPSVTLQVRITDYNANTGGQIPLSNWSEDTVVLASTQMVCSAVPQITTLTPGGGECVQRNATNATRRTLYLDGVNFPWPRNSQNLQFKRLDTGAESIYIGLEVQWISANKIELDMGSIQHYLWPAQARIPLVVRLTDYNPSSGGQVPISDWSGERFIFAKNKANCY